LLEEAIALDSGFAMAYRKLAVAIDNSQGLASRVAAAATQAFLRRDRLPDIERELASAYYYGNVKDERAKQATDYRTILSLDPDNGIALNNLALALNADRQFAEAESLAARSLKMTGTILDFDKLMLAQIGQGKLADARLTVDAAAKKLPPGNPDVIDFKSRLAMVQRDYPDVRRLIAQIRDAQRGSPTWQMRTSMELAQVAEA